MKYTSLNQVNISLLISHIDYAKFRQEFFDTVKQLFFQNEYKKIIDYISLNIPKFFLKYPGYQIILFKLILFQMIKENKSKNDIIIFYSNEFLTLINKYDNPFDDDIGLFNYLKDNADIFNSRIYEESLEDCYKALEKGLETCLMIFYNLDKINYNIYVKEKILFLNDVNLLFNFEQHIINKYENSQNENYNNIQLINSQNYLIYDLFSGIDSSDFTGNNFFFPYYKFQSLESVNNNNKNDNNNFFNANLFFTTKENKNNKNLLELNNKKRNRTSKLSTNSKTNSYKSSSFSIKKSKIKEYQFRTCKRENIDKKILRKFNKYLKQQNKSKLNLNIIDYINDSEFFQDFIKHNLMPPFEYDTENVKFKSFNTNYLLWFFGHKHSLELYNIFIENNYDEILEIITKKCKFNKNFDELNLLKSYLYKMPQIFGPIEERQDSNDIIFEENDSNENNINNSYFSNNIINLEESEKEKENQDNKMKLDYNLINNLENNINDNGEDYILREFINNNSNYFINKNDNNFGINNDLEEDNNHTLFQQDYLNLTNHKIMI